MKCRYSYCKLGGEVEKDDAVKDGNRYYHKECYIKNSTKAKIRDMFKDNQRITQRDMNITLKKAIDEIGYPVAYVEYVARNFKDEFKTAYNILYHLKIEQNYKDYASKERDKIVYLLNDNIKRMDIDDDCQEFNYKNKKTKRFKIY